MKTKHNRHKVLTVVSTVVFCILLALLFFPENRLKTVDELLNNNGFNGAVLIAKNNNIQFKKAYGLSKIEDSIPNSTKTIFRIGSLTKEFTAVAIMQLHEKGLVSLNDSISNYIDYPNGEFTTIHHLLSHSSGLPTLKDINNLSELLKQKTTPLQTIKQFQNLPTHFEPGKDCEYNDLGYIVLGAIIESVSGLTYNNYLQRYIFYPLEMYSTYHETNPSISSQANGYVNKNGIIQNADYIDMSFPHAAGGLVSTVEDLYKFDMALKNRSILSKDSLSALFSIQASNKNNQISYGYGFRIGPMNPGMEDGTNSTIGHFGSINGFTAAHVHQKDSDLTVILLSNEEGKDIKSLYKKINYIISSSWR